MKYAPAGRPTVTLARQAPLASQLFSVALVTIGAPPTRGFTVTATVVPVGTPEVARPIAAWPGTGSTRSTLPSPPCGGDGTGCPATVVMATVGVIGLTTAPGPGARTACGSL